MTDRTADSDARPNETYPVRILVMDREPCFAEGLKAALRIACPYGEIVASDGQLSALDVLPVGFTPDVLVLDSRIVLSHGWVEGISSIKTLMPHAKVVIITASIGQTDAIAALERGIHGCISRSASASDLAAFVRMAASGGLVFSPITSAVSLFDESLTKQDRQLLAFAAEGLDNDQIAREMAISRSTLKRQMRRLIVKLQARNRTHALVTAARNGLL